MGSCGKPGEESGFTNAFPVVQREMAVSNGVKLSREEFRLGKSGQISQWGGCAEVSVGR